jgi:hypothetical protein
MASDGQLVIKELFMHLESPPSASSTQKSPSAAHWASAQNPPHYWGQNSRHWIQQAN